MNLKWGCFFIVAFPIASPGQNNFYDQAKIQKIEIFFTQPNWDQMMDTAYAGTGGYLKAKEVRINGYSVYDAGVKYKGNSSYDSTFKKNPIHIELDAFQEQDYNGIKDIKLSNGYADPSLVREVLAYEIIGKYMPAPVSNFAQLYINGTYFGLYSNSESINKTFCSDHFFSDDGVFVKGNPNLTPSPSVKSNLKFINGDTSSYYNYYEMKSGYGWKKLMALCDTLTNKPASIDKMINLDRFIWMLAFNTLLVNLDSYNGAFAQNYYLYQDHTGLFNPIIWDLNMSFGGFPFLGSGNNALANLSISAMQTLPGSIHSADQYWPVIKALFANSTFKRRYYAHLKTMIDENFSNDLYITRFNALCLFVDTAVKSDAKKFFAYSDFQNSLTANIAVGSYSVPGVQTLMAARVNYFKNTPEYSLAAPSISNIKSASVAPGKDVVITASISGAQSAWLWYRFSANTNFTAIPMYDDGAHGDGSPGDLVFGAGFLLKGNHAQYFIYSENTDAGIFSPARAEHEFYTLDVYPHPGYGQIVINEFLANNQSDVRNEFHSCEDWIELQNTTNKTLSLGNYFLSDSRSNKTRYQFPADVVIRPGEFLIVWADEFQGTTKLHSNFKLNENGDRLVLSDGLRMILDDVSFGAQEPDVSQARCPDGYGLFQPSNLPSYGTLNCITAVDENAAKHDGIKAFPVPADGSFTVRIPNHACKTLQAFNGLGALVFERSADTEMRVDASLWQPGVYILKCGDLTEKIIISR